MDHDELAARVAIVNWNGQEGLHSRELRTTMRLDMETLKRFLNLWGLARSNPIDQRDQLLSFLNEYVIPSLKEVDPATIPSQEGYVLIEELSQRAADCKAAKGRPTSLLSKLGLAICPEVFIPYDSRVNEALRRRSPHLIGPYGIKI